MQVLVALQENGFAFVNHLIVFIFIIVLQSGKAALHEENAEIMLKVSDRSFYRTRCECIWKYYMLSRSFSSNTPRFCGLSVEFIFVLDCLIPYTY